METESQLIRRIECGMYLLSDRQKQEVRDVLSTTPFEGDWIDHRLTDSDNVDFYIPEEFIFFEENDSSLEHPPVKKITLLDGCVCKLETIPVDDDGSYISDKTVVEFDIMETVEDEIRSMRE